MENNEPKIMKNKALFIAAIFFFLLINTTFFWERRLDTWAIPVFVGLMLFFAILVIAFLWQIYYAVKERFSSKGRNILVLTLALILALTMYKPLGFVNPNGLEGRDFLEAQREGTAGCTTLFRLKEKNRFVERSVCFGVSEIQGNYSVKGDTIYFSQVELNGKEEYFEFAVIEMRDTKSGILRRYKNSKDTVPSELFILKNKLKKLKVNPTKK